MATTAMLIRASRSSSRKLKSVVGTYGRLPLVSTASCIQQHRAFACSSMPFQTRARQTARRPPMRLLPAKATGVSCSRRFIQTGQSPTTLKLSARQVADLEDLLMANVGSQVQDPVLHKDLVSLQWFHSRIAVSEDGTVQILLRLPSLLHPALHELKETVRILAEKEIGQWLLSSQQQEQQQPTIHVNVEVMATQPIPMMARLVEDPEELINDIGPGLANVSHFVAVYSCKGGVGKSTVAVNLAYELARMGGRVGLLDVDLYGPSLPVLIHPADVSIRRSPLGEGMVYPIEHEGVKVLSLGYVALNSGVPGSGAENGPAIMRGPLAGKVVAQMLKGTDWGELDVLILDLPPGTGDVQLAVCQDIQLSGAVAVSTPSKLAAVDTRKGIEMFTSLGVPTLAVVENMAYFTCEGGGKHYPFGRSAMDEDTSVVQLPISTTTNDANDAGEPLCLRRPEGAIEELATFSQLAKNVSRELLKLQYGQSGNKQVVTLGSDPETFDVSTVQLSLDKKSGGTFLVRFYSESGATQVRIIPAELRSRDPKTGDVLERNPYKEQIEAAAAPDDPMVSKHVAKEKKSPSLIPSKVEKKGRYGFAVHWEDGAIIIYSVLSIARAAGGAVRSVT